MFRINKLTGTKISVYHNFHDEVRFHKKHVWKCDGPCRDRKPYFGTVRRATNRKPGPNDYWFKFHEQTCGGTFQKVSNPEEENSSKGLIGSKKVQNGKGGAATPRKTKKVKKETSTTPSKSIKDYFSPAKKDASESDQLGSSSSFVPFAGKGHTLGGVKQEIAASASSSTKPSAARTLFPLPSTSTASAAVTSPPDDRDDDDDIDVPECLGTKEKPTPEVIQLD